MKQKYIIFIIVFLLGSLAAISVPANPQGKGAFSLSGDVSLNYDSAVAGIIYMKRIEIWRIQIKTPYEYKKKNGSGFMVNLFFSRKFTPKAATFPIKFSYLNKTDTLGGSLVVSGKNRGMYSNDTDGTITFKSFGDTVSGEFQMTVLKKKRGQEDQKVTVKGSFTCPRGEAFK